MTKIKKISQPIPEDTLKRRLFYLLTNCPLLTGCSCKAASGRTKVRTAAMPADDTDLVSLHITLPYKMRREALAAGINCSELMRKALKRRLKKECSF